MPDAPSSPSPTARGSASTGIDVSCRLPLFVLFVSAAVWLVIASVFGLISTLKFHNPNFLADSAWLSYGRTHPAYLDAVLYGFCLQAGFGVILWIVARLGSTPLTQPWIVTIGAILWNLGVTAGIIGILAGDGTGFEFLELPGYAALLLFVGYLPIGIWIALTIHRRREQSLYVTQWFFLAALFWFPWICSTGYLLLVTFPVRGVAQAVIAWWFAQNLLVVWLGLVGLGTIFYFVPKLARTELSNRYLALLTFWVLIVFGSWGGIPNSAPVPAWMPALSTVGSGLMLLAILTVALNVRDTLRGKAGQVKGNVPLQFVRLGTIGFILAGLMDIFAALPAGSQITDLTWFTSARSHAHFYAFFALVMFGGIYHILPQLAGFDFPSPKLVRAHFWVAALGWILIVVPLALGGVVQGLKLQDPRVDFLDVTKSTLPFLRASTMGDLLLFAGHILFLVNLAGVVSRFSRVRAAAAYSAATADLFQTAGAKS